MKIPDFPNDASVSLNDFLLGSDAENSNRTSNFPISSIFSLFVDNLPPNVVGIQYFTDGDNTTLTGAGTIGDPYAFNAPDPPELTVVAGGDNITVTGIGSSANPFVVTGDVDPILADQNTLIGRITAGNGAVGQLTAAQVRTLLDVETSTELDARDTANRDRANHTGTQLAATISDFTAAVEAIPSYNNTAWDALTDDDIDTIGFAGGTLTLTKNDASTLTQSLDGRYMTGITAGAGVAITGDPLSPTITASGASDGKISDVELLGTDLIFTGDGEAFSGTIDLSSVSPSLTFENGLQQSGSSVGLGGGIYSNVFLQVYGNTTYYLAGGAEDRGFLTVKGSDGNGGNFGELEIGLQTAAGFIKNGFRFYTDKTDFIDDLDKGIEYAADYSANFTARSLVDKGYVDGLATPALTAGEGITISSDEINLGGTINGATLLDVKASGSGASFAVQDVDQETNGIVFDNSGIYINHENNIFISSHPTTGTTSIYGNITDIRSGSNPDGELRLRTPNIIDSAGVSGQVLTLVTAATGEAEWQDRTPEFDGTWNGDIDFERAFDASNAGYDVTMEPANIFLRTTSANNTNASHIAISPTGINLQGSTTVYQPLTVYSTTDLYGAVTVWGGTITGNGGGLTNVPDTSVTSEKEVLTIDTGNIDWSGTEARVYEIVLTENATLNNPSAPVDGAKYTFRIMQDATGGRTLSFGSNFRWPNEAVPTITAGANSKDYIEVTVDGTELDSVAYQSFGL